MPNATDLTHGPVAALSTALQDAAIGVVRMTGAGCHDIALRCFRPLGRTPVPRRAAVGHVFDAEGDIDLAVLTLWTAPHSFTGEDMAEFSCHGGRVVLYDVLAALLAAGARQAGPGEFTRRAFVGGKLDLAESEAIIDLITAGSRAAARAALSQAGGSLSRRCREIRAALVEADADIMAYVDFSDEGIVQADPASLLASLDAAIADLDRLLSTCKRGRVVRDGLPTAIIGKPNAGKSSLLNLLAGSERAIVTELPGTTRDVVGEEVSVGGLRLRLMDTAGLRETVDPVEKIGVARSRQAADEAALLLAVFDGSRPWSQEDDTVLSLCDGRDVIAVLNKSDLPQQLDGARLAAFAEVVPLSARSGDGLDELSRRIASRYAPAADEVLLTSLRHSEAAARAREAAQRAREAIAAGVEPDIAEVDIREAIEALGEITGERVSEDVVESIFSRFCVGK
ncbi:MAG: tRNA uridine-5-carboxymethylaminomethyl(34) synthesis GTPase MnmE [Clostridia bacterium]|nr:tRNA uridine-5-carboxymethylaminomethyl(34) synthesis GTPase MnmE [Clostridia bacterium]